MFRFPVLSYAIQVRSCLWLPALRRSRQHAFPAAAMGQCCAKGAGKGADDAGADGPAVAAPKAGDHGGQPGTKPSSPTGGGRASTSSKPAAPMGGVLGRPMEDVRATYSMGKELGRGQFGVTHLCTHRATGEKLACKSIAKRKLVAKEDIDDVRREVQIMHHLCGQPNVVGLKGAYEDKHNVHLVMELCAGGELFDRIVQRGHYTERKAAELARVIVGVVEVCHSMGVMHRDLKPENFLFVDQKEEASLKTIDFGLSIFFRPGEFLRSHLSPKSLHCIATI